MKLAKVAAICLVSLIVGTLSAEITDASIEVADSSKTESIAPKLRADFMAYDNVGRQPLRVYFRDMSVSGNGDVVSRIWDFGDTLEVQDTRVYTQKNPFYTYQYPGLYSVQLTVKDASDSTAIVVKKDYIKVKHGRMFQKLAVSVLPTTGIRLGTQVFNSETRMSFVNLDLMTFFGIINSIGVNYEIGRHKSYGPYVLLSGGIEILSFNPPDWNISKNIGRIGIIPHLTAGLGWQFKLDNGNYLYLEGDIGAKNFVAGIYLGLLY